MEPTIERLLVAAKIEEDIRLATAARRAAAAGTRDDSQSRRASSRRRRRLVVAFARIGSRS
jgi:hypothetical protein